jgi:hypothetical protein
MSAYPVYGRDDTCQKNTQTCDWVVAHFRGTAGKVALEHWSYIAFVLCILKGSIRKTSREQTTGYRPLAASRPSVARQSETV